MAVSLSGYLHVRDPQKYGGRQEEYLQFAEAAIQDGVGVIKAGVSSRREITQIFFQVMNDFREKRKAIAVRHSTKDADLFGKLRALSMKEHWLMHTGLYSPYEEYNKLFMRQFGLLLSNMKHDTGRFFEPKASKIETVLGRKFKFDVEVLHREDILKLKPKDPLEPLLQRLLNVEKPLQAIQEDYDLMKRLKVEHPELYRNLSIETVLREIATTFPSPPKIVSSDGRVTYEGNTDNLKTMYALGTLRVEIGGKLFALSRYLTWLYDDHHTDPVETMKMRSKAYVIHQDVFLIDETLQEVARLFEQAVLWNRGTDTIKDLKNRVALFRFVYSHCMPSSRGDGAIGDWFELALYRYHGFDKTCFSQKKLPSFEALASIAFSTYLKGYDNIITVA